MVWPIFEKVWPIDYSADKTHVKDTVFYVDVDTALRGAIKRDFDITEGCPRAAPVRVRGDSSEQQGLCEFLRQIVAPFRIY